LSVGAGEVDRVLDHVIQVYLNEPDLEFVWVGDDAVDPLQQAQTLNILVGAGVKMREEARGPARPKEQITNIFLPRYAVRGIMANNGEMAPRRPERSPRQRNLGAPPS
jgi:hypothetical protein